MRAAFLVTGQPGIGGLRCPPQGHELIAHTGKTMFLIYLLARLLCNRQTVALQISARHYVLFTEQGATIHEGDKPGGIPKDVWALSDTLGMAETHPCSAFLFSQHAHLVHTSSPAARNSKDWVKQISATEHIMDLWSEKEVERLLYVMVLCSVLHWHFVLDLFLDPILALVWNSLRSMDQTSGSSPTFFVIPKTRNNTLNVSMRALQHSQIIPHWSCKTCVLTLSHAQGVRDKHIFDLAPQ